jgi:FMN phosphatase YigB (HAD superfamily)
MQRPADIIFDLDDTLLDTSAVLLPMALDDIEARLGAWGIRLPSLWRQTRGPGWFDELAAREQLTVDQLREIKGLFFRRADAISHLPESAFPLRPSAPELLAALADAMGRADLTLLTAGDRATQLCKLERTGLSRLPWAQVIIVERPEDKALAFDQLVRPGKSIWSVGNRFSTDLAPASERGALVCLIRHGEHIDESVGEITVDAECKDAVEFLKEAWR